jgi:protein-S-isoprenylcysteine O-methyltransferase Ste14
MTQPYQQPGAAVAFWTVIALFALGEYAMRFRSRGNRRGRPAERWSLAVVGGCTLAGVVAAIESAKWSGGSVGAAAWPLFVVGLVVMVAGFGVRQWSILTLGRFFTIDVRVAENQTVVDRGPYRWVRHPSYTGLVLFFVGVGLALGNWASLVALAVLPTLGLLVRIRSEERVLLASFGDDYRRYAAGRPRLFPGIW